MLALMRSSRVRKILISLLSLQLAFPIGSFANSLPKPTDRWTKSNNTVMSGLPATVAPVSLGNELPDATPEVKVGDVVIDSDGNTMTVTQSTDRALVDWDSFNIGRENTVDFKQPDQNSVILNRIYQQSPSRIFGQMSGNGNVWLFNPNGIFFGAGSQVNVRGMIASTMEFTGLDESTFATADLFGAINNNQPFLSNAQMLAEGTDYCAGDDCSIRFVSSSDTFCEGAECNLSMNQAIIQGEDAVACSGADCQKVIPRIIVEKGAVISSKSGGPVLLAAQEVINEGEITAQDGGQVVLAASKKDVYLAISDNDSDLRGFIVEVDSGSETVSVNVASPGEAEKIEDFTVERGTGTTIVVGSNGNEVEIDRPAAGSAVNAGSIVSNFGNITLVASEVIQAGQLKSTTAIDVNGSIRLIARDGGAMTTAKPGGGKGQYNPEIVDALYFDNTDEMPDSEFIAIGKNPGTLILQADSRTTIDIDSSDRKANSSLSQVSSRIHLEGKQVYMGEGASIEAPGADLTVRARANPVARLDVQELDEEATFIMDRDAVIDVSGTTDTVLEADRNIVDFFITSNELKDAPEQKGGALLRQNVKVDIRKGTPLFDWTTALDNIDKTASERSINGGSVVIRSGALEMGAGATIDVSGGKVSYKGGEIESSWLLSGNKIIDIADADANTPYNAVFLADSVVIDDPKWGQRPNSRPLSGSGKFYREAYEEGGDAGYIYVESVKQFYDPNAVLKAEVIRGPYQRSPESSPITGTISLNSGLGLTNFYVANTINDFVDDVIEGHTLLLKEQLENSGAGKIKIQTGGVVQMGVETNPLSLTLASGTYKGKREVARPVNDADLFDNDFLINASGVTIIGDIRAPGSDVTIRLASSLTTDERADQLIIDGMIDTSGNWTNDSILAEQGKMAERFAIVNAGNISLRGSNLKIGGDNPAGLIADAGAWINNAENLKIGSAGDISINSANTEVDFDAVEISAIDGGSGGLLSFGTKDLEIGGSGETAIQGDLATIANDFFDNASVGGFDITADGNILVTEEADISLYHQSLVAPEGEDGFDSLLLADSAESIAGLFNRTTLRGADEYRAVPGQLVLTATRQEQIQTDKGIINIANGAKIMGPAGSALTLSAQKSMRIAGEITLPGGTLNASITQTSTEKNDPTGFNYLLVDEGALIDLSANAVAVPVSPYDSLEKINPAGTLNLFAEIGTILVKENVYIGLAGLALESTGIIAGDSSGGPASDLSGGGGIDSVSRYVAAGTINIKAERGFAIAGVVDFGFEEAGYQGGQYNIELTNNTGRESENTTNLLPLDIVLGSDQARDLLADFNFGDEYTDMGKGYLRPDLTSVSNIDRLSIDADNSQYSLINNELSKVSVSADTVLEAKSSIAIDTTWLDLDNNTLILRAPYVQLGETNIDVTDINDQDTPTEAEGFVDGEGSLEVVASLIDLIGNLAVSGGDTQVLNASHGVRVRSVASQSGLTFSVAPVVWSSYGALQMNTPVLYATTLSNYSFNVSGESQVAINPLIDSSTGNTVERTEPILSYGGTINMSADTIVVDSRIQNPFGSIDLNAEKNLALGENSKLSVAAVDDTKIPFGQVQGEDLFWTYIVDGNAPLRFSNNPASSELLLPEKSISLKSPVINAQQGSEQDLSGGGNVFGTEFVAGLGGSVDRFNNQSVNDRFVLVPTLTSGFAPFDFMASSGSDIPFGASIEIKGSNTVADGFYTVLPASYVFLEGATVVTPAKVSDLVTAQYKSQTGYGSEIIAGRFSNSDATYQTSWNAYVIDPGYQFATDGTANDPRGEYVVADLDTFFAPTAPGLLPSENGRLLLSVPNVVGIDESVVFNGRVLSSEQSAVGTRLDIDSTQSIRIAEGLVAGKLTIDPGIIDQTEAASILVGGTRSWDQDKQAWTITTNSPTVELLNARLSPQELMITASNEINIDNSQIDASSEPTFAGSQWSMVDGPASLMVSNTANSQMLVTGESNSDGSLSMTNSIITSGGALGVFYDGLGTMTGIDAQGANVQIIADNLSLGEAGVANIVADELSGVNSIALQAGDTLSFNDNVSIDGAQEISLRAAIINVAEDVSVELTATDTLTLAGQSSSSNALKTDNSKLSVNAAEIILGKNEGSVERLSIGASVEVNASAAVYTRGDITAEITDDLTMATPGMYAIQQGEVDINVEGGLQVSGVNSDSKLREVAPGAIFRLSADELFFDSKLTTASGLVSLVAREGDLVLGSNAAINVSPFEVSFPDSVRRAQAGVIQLGAGNNITINTMNALNFGAVEQSGQGGALELYADNEISLGTIDTLQTWTAGGLDLKIVAANIALDDVAALNAAGFNDDLDITLINAGASVTVDQTLSSNNLSIAVARGELTIASGANLQANDATRMAVLYGDQGLTVKSGSFISVQGDKEGLALQSLNGGVVVEQGAKLDVDGKLEVVKNIANANTSVVIDASDTVSEVDVFLATTETSTTVQQAIVQGYFNTLVTAISGLTVSYVIDTAYDVAIRPLVDISSPSDITVGNDIDLRALRYGDEAGRLQVRSENSLHVNNSISDGVEIINTGLAGFVSILLNDESWDINLSAGALTGSGYDRVNFSLDPSEAFDINLADGTHVRTGTGDIKVQASGNIYLGANHGDKAYIATLGRAEYIPDLAIVGGLPRPVWGGDKAYTELVPVLSAFSGISIESGDVMLSAGDSVVGFSDVDKTPKSFMQTFAPIDTLIFKQGPFEFDYTDRRIIFAAIEYIETGVHAIAGGDVMIDAGNDLFNLGVSTPGVARGATQDKVLSVQNGGSIAVTTGGDVVASAFANDGAAIDVRAFGNIRNFDASQGEVLPAQFSGEDVNPSIFLMASDSDISFVAGGDLALDGIANTHILPISDRIFFKTGLSLPPTSEGNLDTAEDFAGFFFQGYDTTSLSLTGVGGDIEWRADLNNVLSILGRHISDNVPAITAEDARFRVMPSVIDWNALGGSIYAKDDIVVFPSSVASINLYASENIATYETSDIQYFYIPDYEASVLPTADNMIDVRIVDDALNESAFPIVINPNSADEDQALFSPLSIIDRSAAADSNIFALNGSIGSDFLQAIYVPTAIDIYAGQDIVNTGVFIQHANVSDVSSIIAGRDFKYTLEVEGISVATDRQNQIEIAGPGDLIVAAGNNIELAASEGIVSIGNTNNSLLDRNGASLHVYAGYVPDNNNFSALVGSGINDLSTLPSIARLNLSDQELAAFGPDEWFIALADQVLEDLKSLNGKSIDSLTTAEQALVTSVDSKVISILNGVSRATGKTYSPADDETGSPDLDSNSVDYQAAISFMEVAVDDWKGLEGPIKSHVSVFATKEMVLSDPALAVDKGELLFGKKPQGVAGFDSQEQRTTAFGDYWSGVSGLITLDTMLTPERVGELEVSLPAGVSMDQFYAMPIDQQVNLAVDAFNSLDSQRQLLVAEQVMQQHVRQTGIEAINSGKTFYGFERGFVALNRFFGDGMDPAITGALLRTKAIQAGVDEGIKPDELNFGLAEGRQLASFTEVVQAWSDDSGEDFDLNDLRALETASSLEELDPDTLTRLQEKFGRDFSFDPDSTKKGEIDLVFSSIRTIAPGANINIMAPSGQVEVGSSADLVQSLGIKVVEGVVETNRLGVITELMGDINAVVASGFNVDESRAFSLAGGDMSLWASWGDIDAGKGAKTAATTPAPSFTIDPNNGAITKLTPAAVSGSGIKAETRRLDGVYQLSDQQRFYEVSNRDAGVYLSTPLGVVDAGEAGIETDGQLFVGALQVKGADNINVGGVSVGVSTNTSISANVASAGNSSSQVSSTATDSMASSTGKAMNSANAFISIELLDTGISE